MVLVALGLSEIEVLHHLIRSVRLYGLQHVSEVDVDGSGRISCLSSDG